MREIDLIIIAQSEVVGYSDYSRFPLDKIQIYANLVFPRMIYTGSGFRSHLDVINGAKFKTYWEEAGYSIRRRLYNIWNLPGLNGILIANYLKQYNLNTHVINNFDAEWDIFCGVYEGCEKKPLVGISTTFHLNYSTVARISQKIRKNYPDAEIVLGGPFVYDQMNTYGPEHFGKAMSRFGINYSICSYNSEADLRDLILWRNVNRAAGIDSVNNLGYLGDDKSTFNITQTAWNPPLLDALPSQWDRLNLPFLRGIFPMKTSSGCPFHCAFCSYPELAKTFRTMDVMLVEEHIRNILRLKINNIFFIDDTFNVPTGRFKTMCRSFAKYDFEWFSFLRAQFVDDETALLMKAAGCRGVFLGIESANDQILQNMNKKATRADFLRGIEYLKKYDITIMAAFIIGFPGETDMTIRDNVEFIETSGIDFYTLKEFYYLKNTEVDRSRAIYGLTGSGNNWNHRTMNSNEAYSHKMSMFREIRNSVFIDPDMSLWYIAYLYSQGYSIDKIASIQRILNKIVDTQYVDGVITDISHLLHRLDSEFTGAHHLCQGRFSENA